MRADRFLILAWHSINVLENRYEKNDLLAFEADLRTLDRAGCTILPLGAALRAQAAGTLPGRAVVLTADDGSVMDFEDFDHPTCGPQKGMYRIMGEFLAELPDGHRHDLHLTSFVIASPEARGELDRRDFMGLNVWDERWWRPAAESGRIGVESHTWDHNHPSLARTAQRDNRRGDFRFIDTEDECRAEVDRASDYIERVAGRRPRFLGYPYGQASDYLRREYLPRFGPGLGLEGALACEPEPVAPDSDRWYLPRFMFGRDWRRPGELEAVLRQLD